jgi:catechol 2,3-dioxygenase-like lactoylglutathione lyase family enzyme
MITNVPNLAGAHHLKLPVRDLMRSEAWYGRVLGYRRAAEFRQEGVLMGLGLLHPAGGPEFGLRLDPARAEAAAGFVYFGIGVADEAGLLALAARLDSLGEPHGGVVRTKRSWLLPLLHDPDGHELRFFSVTNHTAPLPGEVMRVGNGRELVEQARLSSEVVRASL